VGAGFYSGIIQMPAPGARHRHRPPHVHRRNQPARNQDGNAPRCSSRLANSAEQVPDPHECRAGARLVGGRRFEPLNPGVRDAWNDYLGRVSPLALKADPGLEFFLSSKQAYERTWTNLPGTGALPTKPAALLNLRTNKFAPLVHQFGLPRGPRAVRKGRGTNHGRRDHRLAHSLLEGARVRGDEG